MKRISLFLCAIMLFTCTQSAFSYGKTVSIDGNQKMDLVELFEKSGADVKGINIDNVNRVRSFTATYSDGMKEFVEEKTYLNGSKEYTIKDRVNKNTIIVKNKDVYLDGEKVDYSQTSTMQIVPATMNTYICSKTPLASDYSVYNGYTNRQIVMPKAMRDMTKGGCLLLIGAIFPYVGIALSVFDIAYGIIKAANPGTKTLYYRQYSWAYSGNSPLSGYLSYKYKTNWYTDSARTKLAESKTSYAMYVL
jgi:hypothetical protein